MYGLLICLHLGHLKIFSFLQLGQVNLTNLTLGAISFLQQEQTTIGYLLHRLREPYEKCFPEKQHRPIVFIKPLLPFSKMAIYHMSISGHIFKVSRFSP